MSEAPEFSLGAALIGAEPAAGCAAPGQHAPQDWLAAFAAQAGADVLLGLSRSCRAGQDFTIQFAPLVWVNISSASSKPIDVLLTQFDSAKQRLSTSRGTQPTGVRVTCDGSLASGTLFVLVPQALCQWGALVSHLSVSFHSASHDRTDRELRDWFISEVAAALPRLRSLSLNNHAGALPPPTLPNLTHLRLRQVVTRTRTAPSVSALFPQLVAFELLGPYSVLSILSPAAASTTLTHLTIPEPLTHS